MTECARGGPPQRRGRRRTGAAAWIAAGAKSRTSVGGASGGKFAGARSGGCGTGQRGGAPPMQPVEMLSVRPRHDRRGRIASALPPRSLVLLLSAAVHCACAASASTAMQPARRLQLSGASAHSPALGTAPDYQDHMPQMRGWRGRQAGNREISRGSNGRTPPALQGVEVGVDARPAPGRRRLLNSHEETAVCTVKATLTVEGQAVTDNGLTTSQSEKLKLVIAAVLQISPSLVQFESGDRRAFSNLGLTVVSTRTAAPALPGLGASRAQAWRRAEGSVDVKVVVTAEDEQHGVSMARELRSKLKSDVITEKLQAQGLDMSASLHKDMGKPLVLDSQGKSVAYNASGDVPLGLILGICIPAVLILIGLVVAFINYRYKRLGEQREAEREHEELKEKQRVKMKNEMTVSADVIFDVGDPPKGPGEPSMLGSRTSAQCAHDNKGSAAETGMILGLGPVFAESKVTSSSNLTDGAILTAKSVRVEEAEDAKMLDKASNGGLVSDMPSAAPISTLQPPPLGGQFGIGPAPPVAARGRTPRDSVPRPAVGMGGVGGDTSQRLEQLASPEALPARGTYSNNNNGTRSARLPSASSADGRPSVPRVLSHRTPSSSSRGRAASGEHANGTGTYSRGVESETTGGKQRAPYLPERISLDPAKEEGLQGLPGQLANGLPVGRDQEPQSRYDKQVMQENMRNMQSYAASVGLGDNFSESGSVSSRLRALPKTPPNDNSPRGDGMNEVGGRKEGRQGGGAGDWWAMNDVNALQPPNRPAPPRHLPAPQRHHPTAEWAKGGGVLTLDPDTMLPTNGLSPPSRARTPGSNRSNGRPGQNSSFASGGDESDSDGEGRHGHRSGRSSPSYSDSSSRSESNRSHDGWRNGFRTRANSQLPNRADPGRRRIMDLHKQIFNQEVGTPRANMATPVELPGDKGVSFYQGRSSLHGRMHVRCIEDAANNFRERPAPVAGVIKDEDEVWG